MIASPDVLAQLLRFVRDAAREGAREGAAEALAAHVAAIPSDKPKGRVTLDELTRLEACSSATIRRLVAEGAPVTYLGQSPRFDVEAFRQWLGERGRAATKTTVPKASGSIHGVRLLSRGRP